MTCKPEEATQQVVQCMYHWESHRTLGLLGMQTLPVQSSWVQHMRGSLGSPIIQDGKAKFWIGSWKSICSIRSQIAWDPDMILAGTFRQSQFFPRWASDVFVIECLFAQCMMVYEGWLMVNDLVGGYLKVIWRLLKFLAFLEPKLCEGPVSTRVFNGGFFSVACCDDAQNAAPLPSFE